MPIPAAVGAALINTGANLVGAVTNSISTAKMNKKQRKFIRERYDVERADALSDWALQNEYNSPRQQMQRLQEAGLNPHLVYGGGSGVTEAGSIRSTDSKSYNPDVPRYGDVGQAVGQGVLSFYDLKIKKAQADNLTAMNTKILMDTMEKQIDIQSKGLTQKQREELDSYSRSLYEQNPMLFQWNEGMRKIASQYRLTEEQERELTQRIRHNEQKHPHNLEILVNTVSEQLQRIAKSQEEVKEIQQRVKVLLQDERLKRLHAQLRENGVEPTDPQWQRLIIRAINGEGIVGKKLKNN